MNMNNNDVRKKLDEVLKSGAMPRGLESILSSPQGKRLAQNLSGQDKEKLLKMFMSMDTNEIKNKMKNVNISDLSAEEILKNLR